MSRGVSIALTPLETQVLDLYVRCGGEALDVDEVTRRLEVKRAYVARALFALRRKGYLKRENWMMLPAVPLSVIEYVIEGDGDAECRC